MRRFLMTAVALLGLALWLTTPALAQGHKSAVGWTAGVLTSTSLNDGAGSGDGSVDIKPDLTWTVGMHYDHWLGGGNVGIRVNGALAKQTLPWTQGDRDIYVYMADLSLMLRPVSPAPNRSVLPYISGGVGLVRRNLGDGPTTIFTPAGASYGGEDLPEFAPAVGVGIDIITPWRWGEGPLVLRLEGRNWIQLSSHFEPANPDDADFGMVHNAAVFIGVHTGMGLLRNGG
jgi:hypothetical protein